VGLGEGFRAGDKPREGGLVIRVNHMGFSKQKCTDCPLESRLQVLVE
jgi:hypothetical protein